MDHVAEVGSRITASKRPPPREDPMNRTFSITLFAASVATAVGPAARGGKEPAAQADKGAAAPAAAAGLEVKIGHVGPLTGGIAHLGKDNENGARIAVDEANAAGIKID